MVKAIRVVPYRNMDGYPIRLDRYAERQHVKVFYTRCPETDGLRGIKQCKACPMFGRFSADGVECKSKKQYVEKWWKTDVAILTRGVQVEKITYKSNESDNY